jgi:hypothetical protein
MSPKLGFLIPILLQVVQFAQSDCSKYDGCRECVESVDDCEWCETTNKTLSGPNFCMEDNQDKTLCNGIGKEYESGQCPSGPFKVIHSPEFTLSSSLR